jgi:DNA-binding transcriptional MerR regulator
MLRFNSRRCVQVSDDLISKKELLELTGISYGQLYRWKRKNLIPEEWFIRKSTFTGQETFFPKDKILARIEKIKDMKDELSLDQLADMFSPNPTETTLYKEEILKRNIVSKMVLEFYVNHQGERDTFTFEDILHAYILEKLLQTGEMSLEEGTILLEVLGTHYEKFRGKSCELILLRKMGISTFILLSNPSEIYFDTGVKVVTRLSVTSCIEELKIKISEG